MSEASNDSPTHRMHILQLRLPEIKSDLEAIRYRRGLIIEKVAKAKSNSKVARAAQVDKQLKKFFDKMERQLAALEEDIQTIEDNMNKARALILEASDGELMLPKTETSSGKTDP
jgi:predicted  nucleic acid-binding Zn-ribbon protein